MSNVYGDILVKRTLTANMRVNEGANNETLTAAKSLIKHDAKYQILSAAAGQDCILPDATGLPKGWSVCVKAAGAAALAVKTYHATTPVLLKSVLAGRMYEFTLLTNVAAAGTWHINFLEEADLIPVERYAQTFDASTDWGTAAGGYYTITVTAATHGRGVSPNVQIFELSGSDYLAANVDEVKVNTSGDVAFRVPETPDSRFAGKIVMV